MWGFVGFCLSYVENWILYLTFLYIVVIVIKQDRAPALACALFIAALYRHLFTVNSLYVKLYRYNFSWMYCHHLTLFFHLIPDKNSRSVKMFLLFLQLYNTVSLLLWLDVTVSEQNVLKLVGFLLNILQPWFGLDCLYYQLTRPYVDLLGSSCQCVLVLSVTNPLLNAR